MNDLHNHSLAEIQTQTLPLGGRGDLMLPFVKGEDKQLTGNQGSWAEMVPFLMFSGCVLGTGTEP